MKKRDGLLELTIRDNGEGFDPALLFHNKKTVGGLGIAGMRERTALSGGTFSIESKEGVGALVRAAWPI